VFATGAAWIGPVAVPGRDEAGAFVIRIDKPDGVAEHEAGAVAEAGARQYQRAPMRVADAERDTGRDQDGGCLRPQDERGVEAGVGGAAGREIGAIVRKPPLR